MPRTFLEKFACSTAAVLADVVNKHAERKGLEILSISINVDKEARYKYEAIVLFESLWFLKCKCRTSFQVLQFHPVSKNRNR